MTDTPLDPDRRIGLVDAEPAQPVAAAQPRASREDRGRASGYRSRFVVVYVCLGIIAALAFGAFAVSLLDSPEKAAAPAAPSEFAPTQGGEIGAIQLAEAVQKKYRLPNGSEFTGVVASRNTLQDGNLGLIRVNYQYVQPFDAQKSKDSMVVRPTDAIQYSLCGAGAGCTIPGKASQTRFALLKREGLELAIRTFQNDPSVDNVSVFLRPVASSDPNWEGYSLVFDRATLNRDAPGLLDRPLASILPGKRKTITATQLKPKEIKRIDELTRPYLYLYRYQLLGGRDALMQLQPAKS